MATLTLPLANTTVRRSDNEERDYREFVRLRVDEKSFAIRVISLNFPDGPELNLSTFDMDRVAIEYLKLRGLELSPTITKLLNAEPPPRCSFIVPVQQMANPSKNGGRDDSSKTS
jgi:hypothetical protein